MIYLSITQKKPSTIHYLLLSFQLKLKLRQIIKSVYEINFQENLDEVSNRSISVP